MTDERRAEFEAMQAMVEEHGDDLLYIALTHTREELEEINERTERSIGFFSPANLDALETLIRFKPAADQS